MQVNRRHHHADQRREYDERHHARLEQRQIVADASHARLSPDCLAPQRRREPGAVGRERHHLIRGSSLNWWNGGGDGSVHSSVVAPGPHGLAAAFSLRANAWNTPMKKITRPNDEM